MAGNKTGPVHRGEEGFWLNGKWTQYLDLLPDEEREELPYTVPDEDLRTHSWYCRCKPCRAPYVDALKRSQPRRTYYRPMT